MSRQWPGFCVCKTVVIIHKCTLRNLESTENYPLIPVYCTATIRTASRKATTHLSGQLFKYVQPLSASLLYCHSSQKSLSCYRYGQAPFPKFIYFHNFQLSLWIKTSSIIHATETQRVIAFIASVSSKLLLGLCAPASLAFL